MSRLLFIERGSSVMISAHLPQVRPLTLLDFKGAFLIVRRRLHIPCAGCSSRNVNDGFIYTFAYLNGLKCRTGRRRLPSRFRDCRLLLTNNTNIENHLTEVRRTPYRHSIGRRLHRCIERSA